MEKLTAVSGVLFLIADVFAIASLAHPEWIITDVAGHMRLGLTQHCQRIYGRPEICMFPRLSLVWMLTFILICSGIICLTVTCSLQFLSHWKRKTIKYARWIAFTASTCHPINFVHLLANLCFKVKITQHSHQFLLRKWSVKT
ncbi:hypothetical protein CHS0354_028648 [Potamilus streckersoni]|uniref:Uncharacterized protein n=1 Tax=Potamilus streckersoni TaxID=2493646 RepID=A0AAE0SWD3_9BIVA|nr:hypothetical protein CHS0354_028648 [Potamilus streckersoni]